MEKKEVNVLARLLLVAVIFGLLTPLVAQADDTDARIKRLEAAVNALQRELAAIKVERAREARKPAPVVDQRQLERLISKAFDEKKGEFGVAPDWVQNITPFGDFRYRYESLNADTGEGNSLGQRRRRNRIRARLGFKAKINDEWDTIFRIASGSSDTPTSTNQTLDGSFESKDLWLDLAYADWHPEAYPGSNLYLGKMKMPFYRVGKNELIWDGDVNPEGAAASYKYNLSDSVAATLIGGAFWLNERSTGADAGYFGIQAFLKQKLDGGSHLLGGVSYYDIGNIDGKAVAGSGVTLEGNTDAGSGTGIYRYDYDVVELFGEYGFKCGPMPVAVFGNYVENTASTNGNNTAYSIGFQLNKAKKPGSWQFKAGYREVESDAVFAGLSDSDFIDGGTGGKGWELAYKYQLTKNMYTAFTYFINDRDRRVATDASGGAGSENFTRFQADLVFKF